MLVLLSFSLVLVSISISWLPVSADDTDPPSIIDVKVKPEDRLELGDTPFFEVKVEDKSGINQVLIEYEGANHSMEEKNLQKWTYNSWTPTAIEVYIFTIHAEDKEGNWAQESGKLEIVLDATPPEVVIIDAPEGEIEGGETILISVFVNDTYEIIQVLLEFGDSLESMKNVDDSNVWEYELDIPLDVGLYTYKIHVEDINHNWNSVSGSIEVIGEPSDNWGMFIIIFSIIGALLGISLVMVARRNQRLGDQRSIRSAQIIKDQHYLNRDSRKTVEVKCPTCYKSKNLPLSISIPRDSNGLCNVFISKNVICEHSFQIYVDSFHAIRGRESVDYTLGEEL